MNEILVDKKWIGIPFKWMGRDFDGIDCAGLVYKFLEENGIKPKVSDSDGLEYSQDWKKEPQRFLRVLNEGGKKIPPDITKLKPFDVLCFRIKGKISHVGIYLGYGRFLHVHKDCASCIERLESSWKDLWAGAIRPTEEGSEDGFELSDAIGDPVTIGVTLIAASVAAAFAPSAGAAIFAFAAIVLLSAAAYFLAPKPAQPNFGLGGVAEGSLRYGSFGALQSTASSDLSVPILYGTLKLAGNSVYQSLPGTSVNRCDVLCMGEVDAIDSIKINDQVIGDLSGCSVTAYYGTRNQTLDSRFTGSGGSLVPGLRNAVYLALTLQSSDKLNGGFPAVTAILKGIKVQTWDGVKWVGCDTLGDGLIAHWKMNDNVANTTVVDSAQADGIANTGTASQNTSVMTVTGKIGSALNFNGTNDFVSIADNSRLRLTRGGSISAWIYLKTYGSAGVNRRIIDKSTFASGTNGWLLCVRPDGSLGFGGPVFGSDTAPGTIPLNTWTHVTAVFDDTVEHLYINAVQSEIPNDTVLLPLPPDVPSSLKIGNRAGATDQPWDGYIDDVRVYDRVLSEDEVRELYNKGSGTENYNTKVWSDNPAACIRDLVISTRYGSGIPVNMLDDSSFGLVYDYANQYITSYDGIPENERRYTLDYVVDARRPALDVLVEMLGTFGGYLVWSGGRLRLKVEKGDSYIQKFTMSNIVEKSFSYRYIPKDDAVNRVKIQYVDPAQNYTKVFAIAEDTALQDEREAEGSEGVIEKEYSLYGITRFSQATRIANMMLKSVKAASIGCMFRTGTHAIHCEPGDVVLVSHDVPAWVDKTFRVVDIKELENDEMEITCKEYNNSIYDDSYGSSIAVYQYGTPPNPLKPPNAPSNVTATESGYGFVSKSGQWITVVHVAWNVSVPSDFIQYYSVEYTEDALNYVSVGTTTGTSLDVQGLNEGTTYTFRVKAVNYYGLASNPAYSSPYTVVGKNAPPSNVTGFSVSLSINSYIFSWNAVPDVDIKGYEIKEGSDWNSATLISTGISATTFLFRPVIVGTHIFRIKAIDTSGNYSATEDVDTITVTTAPDINVTIDEYLFQDIGKLVSEGRFIGEISAEPTNRYSSLYNRKTLCVRTDKTFDELEALGLTYAQHQAAGLKVGEPLVTGVNAMYMSRVIDLASVYSALATLEDIVDNQGIGTYTVEINYSTDGISWSDWEVYSPAKYYNLRLYQLRLTFDTTSQTTNMFIDDVIFKVDVPDLSATDGGNGVQVQAGGTVITYQRAFTVAPRSLVVSTVDKSSNVTAVITNQTNAGFTCTLYDTTNTSVSGKINYWARGY